MGHWAGTAQSMQSPCHLHTFSISPAQMRVALLRERNMSTRTDGPRFSCGPVTVGRALRRQRGGCGWQLRRFPASPASGMAHQDARVADQVMIVLAGAGAVVSLEDGR